LINVFGQIAIFWEKIKNVFFHVQLQTLSNYVFRFDALLKTVKKSYNIIFETHRVFPSGDENAMRRKWRKNVAWRQPGWRGGYAAAAQVLVL
jgi:hypothetical protein